MASSDEAPLVESSSAAVHNDETLAKEGETLTKESNSAEVDETLAAKEGETLTKESTSAEVDETLASEKGKKAVCEDPSETISHAEDLVVRGSKAIEDGDFVEAVDCLSRAVEIRVTHYGELAPECASAYYKYGCALLYKAQDEADPLVTVPKKESNSLENSVPDGAAESVEIIEGSAAPVVGAAKPDSVSSNNEGEMEGEGASDKDQEEDSNGSEGDGEDLAEADEDDSDLDLAWKMLDVARAIVENNPCDTIEKVDILAALGEVSLEREDIETSLSDYLKALSILERLVEPDSRRIAELNFRMCLVLEVGSRTEDAVLYCQKAISTCKARLQRLTAEVKNSTILAATVVDTSSVADVDEKEKLSPHGPMCDPSILEKEKEIETLSGLSIELERKLEDLQQAIIDPQSVFSEVFKMVAAKSAADGEKGMSSTEARPNSLEKLNSSSQMGFMNGGGFDSPTVSAAATNGSVTHLGIVGRGVKRAVAIPTRAEPSSKRLSSDSSVDKAGSSVSSEVLDSGTQHSDSTAM